MVLLAEVRWASRVWALPFVSALAPSERYAKETGQRHKSLTEWAWQLLMLVRRWYPDREIVAVADSTYASLKRSSSTDVVEGSPIRLPSSLACAWTPPSTSQPHHVVPVK